MPTVPHPPAAIVIAGGRSTRFGSDKLSAQVDGRSLLERTIDAVAGCRPVVVVTGSEARVADHVVTVSEYPRWGGPCAALAAGLTAIDGGAADALIVAADLAHPEAAVAGLLAIESGVLADSDGRPQWLLARAPLDALRERRAELEADGGTAGRAVRAIIGELGLPLVDAAADAITDIDVREDLDRMKENR